MPRMKHTDLSVIGGVDTHADTHQAAVLDQRGRLLGTAEFATSIGGYQQLLDWLAATAACRPSAWKAPAPTARG
jgi:hypothetical protein